jgi:cardiolipin synthase
MIHPDTFDKIPLDVQRYFSSGNRVTPLFGAPDPSSGQTDVFERTAERVAAATEAVQVEMFSLDHPRMVELLLAKAGQGVRVQVVVDPVNEDFEEPRKAAIERLRAGGVEVHEYPVKARKDGGNGAIDHVKMLIVDGHTAIIGGMNWGAHSPMNHDVDVELEGPGVASLGWLFARDWERAGGATEALPHHDRPAAEGDAHVNLVISGDDPREQTFAKTVLRAVRNARRSIHASLFCLTDYQVIDALVEAKARGVDVKIILDPLRIGKTAMNERACARLRAAGIEVRWFAQNAATLEKLHAKIGLFDDDQTLVGSANWSTSGFRVNREADVEILSTETNAAFERWFQHDWTERTSSDPVYLDPQGEPITMERRGHASALRPAC